MLRRNQLKESRSARMPARLMTGFPLTELAGSSVNPTVSFRAESQQANVLKVSDQVVTGIKLVSDKAGIDMPFPHTVVLLEPQAAGSDITSRPLVKSQSRIGANGQKA